MNTAQNAQISRLLMLKTWLYTILVLLLAIGGTAAWLGVHAPQPERNAIFCGVSARVSDPRYAKGKELFSANCAACHSKNMTDKLTGPPMGPALEAWSRYPARDLYHYIRDNQAMLRKGHPRAVAVWKEYRPTLMPAFKSLTDAELEEMLVYIRAQTQAMR